MRKRHHLSGDDPVSKLEDLEPLISAPPLMEANRHQEALEVAKYAISQLEQPDPAYLDTLAAAFAETGNFDEAIRVELEAIRLFESMQIGHAAIEAARSHLASFRAGIPIREPATSD